MGGFSRFPLYLLGLACKFISTGYRVFWLKDDLDKSYNEINYITELDAKVAIIVENFPRRTEEIKYINLKRSSNLVLLISAKTSLYEFSQEKLSELIEPNSVVDINLNRLINSEIKQLNEILIKYKFWGERDSLSKSQQENFIKHNCSAELSSVLLEIIKSPHIKEKFSTLFNAFHSDNALTDGNLEKPPNLR